VTRLRGVGLGLLGLLVMAGVWELYKAYGPANGLVVGGRALGARFTHPQRTAEAPAHLARPPTSLVVRRPAPGSAR